MPGTVWAKMAQLPEVSEAAARTRLHLRGMLDSTRTCFSAFVVVCLHLARESCKTSQPT